MRQARATASCSLLLEAQDSVVQLRSQAKPKHSGSLGCAAGKSSKAYFDDLIHEEVCPIQACRWQLPRVRTSGNG